MKRAIFFYYKKRNSWNNSDYVRRGSREHNLLSLKNSGCFKVLVVVVVSV